MKRAFVLSAGAIVLLANAWILGSALRNRNDARGGSVELTERELHLPRPAGESTAVFLELEWEVLSSSSSHQRTPLWLDAAKLSELGFDCTVPLTSPDARDRYHSQIARVVFVVPEYEGTAWQQASSRRKETTRLFAVDAGLDPRRLRERYPDNARCVITRARARLDFQEETVPEGKPLMPPRLQGWIQTLLPGRIFVPPPFNRELESLRRREDLPDEVRDKRPRFAVSLSWGANYQPWVTGVRLLPGQEAGVGSR